MSSNSKEIAKLKKKYSKWPPKNNVFKNKSLILGYLPAAFSVWILKHLLIKSDYKLKRESIKFFQLSNRAYGAREFCKCSRLLRIAIELLGSNVPQNYANMLHNAVSATFENSNYRRSSSDSILAATKQLEPIVFDATGWYQLSRGLFSLGYFRAAWVARENSLDLSISESLNSVSSPTTLLRAAEAHLERKNFDSVMDLLTAERGLSPKSLNSFFETLRLLQGIHTEDIFGAPIISSQIDLFREFVTDKNVVLVGPGHPRGEFGSQIDSADTVSRVKFVGEENLPDPILHGARCNIAYQGALESLDEFSGLGMQISFYKNIDFFVSNSKLSEYCAKPVVNLETSIPIYRTSAISGIIFLYQLLGASPMSLKIFGYDFRVDHIQYSKASSNFYKHNAALLGHPYPGFETEKLPAHIISQDFSEHDFVSNFCFAQNLYKAGLFDIEPYGKSILELTPYQYVERLEEMLGDW